MGIYNNSVYKVNSSDGVTIRKQDLDSIVKAFVTKRRPQLQTLLKYYRGEYSVQNEFTEEGKSNHNVTVPIASLIVDTESSQLVGKGVKILSEDRELLDVVNLVHKDNNLTEVDYLTAKNSSIFGVSFELIYVDTDGKERVKNLDTLDTFVIVDNSVENKTLGAVRLVNSINYITEMTETVGFYLHTRDYIEYYEYNNVGTSELKSREVNLLNDVNIIYYLNNSEIQGSFERELTSIDALSRLLANGLNDSDLLSDSILFVKNVGLTKKEKSEQDDIISGMRTKKILAVDVDEENSQDADAKYITKNNDDALGKSLRDDLRFMIATSGNMPLIDPTVYGVNTSGIAIEQRNEGIRNRISNKQENFERGLYKRYKLLVDSINFKNSTNYDYKNIKIKFTRNLPIDYTSVGQFVSQTKGVISTRDILESLPLIDDVDLAYQRILEQKEYEIEMELRKEKALKDMDKEVDLNEFKKEVDVINKDTEKKENLEKVEEQDEIE